MRTKYTARQRAIGELTSFLQNRKNFRTHIHSVKPKLLGYVTQYYKFPRGVKALWVTATCWQLGGSY